MIWFLLSVPDPHHGLLRHPSSGTGHAVDGHVSKPCAASAEHGFSLIEVLIALAITSVVSALIFASLGTQVTQADAVRRSTQAAFDTTMSGRLVGTIVSSTLPSWQDEDVSPFRGSQEVVSGLFVNKLFGPSQGVQAYTITLRREGQESRLEVVVGNETWKIARLPLTAEFRYLGHSGIWRETWPALPSPNSNTPDFQAVLNDYGLPLMMRVWDPATQKPAGFEVRFDNSGVLPQRSQDLFIPQ